MKIECDAPATLPADEEIWIAALGVVGAAQVATNEYEIVHRNSTRTRALAYIRFQKGPILEAGVNGVQIEHLLAIVLHRLREFQKGPFACGENALAIDGVTTAIDALRARTIDRQRRGVEGRAVE